MAYPANGGFWDTTTFPAQPDNDGGVENCVAAGHVNCNNRFSDVNCDTQAFPFVCELNKSAPGWPAEQWGTGCGMARCTPISNRLNQFGASNCSETFLPLAPTTTPIVAPPTPPNASCPRGWYENNQTCYRGVCTLLDWTGAQANCACHGGFLVTANTSARNTLARSLIQLAPSSPPGNVPMWIGLREQGQRDVWWVPQRGILCAQVDHSTGSQILWTRSLQGVGRK